MINSLMQLLDGHHPQDLNYQSLITGEDIENI
jgi:hypothetical protein